MSGEESSSCGGNVRGKRAWSPEEEMRGYEKVEQGTNLMLEVDLSILL